MYRHGTVALFLLLIVGCSDSLRVPPPPVPLTAVDGVETSFDDSTDLMVTNRSSVRLVRALPPGAMVAIHVPDIAGTISRFKRTGLYKLLNSRAMKSMFGEASFKLTPFSATGPDGKQNASVQRIVNAMRGELVISLEDLRFDDPKAPVIRGVGGLTVRGAEADAEQLVQLVGMLAAGQKGIKVEKGTVEGTPFTRVVGKDPFPWVGELALYQDALLFGVGRETVTAAVRRLRNDSEPSLAERPAFSTAMRRCADPRDAFRLHIDLATVMHKYSHYLPAEAKSVIRGLGINRIRSFTTAVGLRGENVTMSTLIDSPGGKDFLTELLAAHPVDRQLLGRIPGGATSFSLFALDGNAIVGRLRKALPESARNDLEAGLKEMRANGFDLERDVFEVFGPRCTLVGMPFDRPVIEPIDAIWNQLLGTSLVVELQDPARAARVIAKIKPKDPTIRRRVFNAGGARAVSYQFDGGHLPQEFALCYAISDGYLVVAPSDETLRRMLKARSAETVERFRKVVKDVPNPAAIITYEDLSSGASMSMQIFMTAFAGIANGRGRSAATGPLDLPDMGESVSYTVADESGVYSFTESPTGGFGSAGGLAGVAIISAIAIPNLLAARMSANETAAIASLRAIHTAEVTYRAQGVRDTDGDGDGEFGFLVDLLGQRRPGDKRVLNTRRLVTGEWKKFNGDYVRNGYYFRVYLPSEDGSPVGENSSKARIMQVDGDLAESIAIIVAWPMDAGRTGRRAFLLDLNGRLWGCEDGSYGERNAPPPDLLSSQKGNLASQPLRRGKRTRDGFTWTIVR